MYRRKRQVIFFIKLKVLFLLQKSNKNNTFSNPELGVWFRVILTDGDTVLANTIPSTEKIPVELV